jgi:cytochrome c oxidase subunit 2
MNRITRGGRGLRAAAAVAAGLPALAHAARDYNLQTPITSIARQQYDLHMFIFWICAVIFVGVFGVMFYSLWKHRKSVGHQAEQFHENTVVEIVWTVIPFLILLFMAYPATKTILAMKDTTQSELTIKVTGYQWKWNYDYLQDGFGYYSSLSTPVAQIENREPKGEHYLLEVDNPMVVPVDTKVRVLITAGDVLHAWWVPALGVKQDAIPASCATAGSAPSRPASTAASARSSAARSTASCRSSSRSSRRPTTRSGPPTRSRRTPPSRTTRRRCGT